MTTSVGAVLLVLGIVTAELRYGMGRADPALLASEHPLVLSLLLLPKVCLLFLLALLPLLVRDARHDLLAGSRLLLALIDFSLLLVSVLLLDVLVPLLQQALL